MMQLIHQGARQTLAAVILQHGQRRDVSQLFVLPQTGLVAERVVGEGVDIEGGGRGRVDLAQHVGHDLGFGLSRAAETGKRAKGPSLGLFVVRVAVTEMLRHDGQIGPLPQMGAIELRIVVFGQRRQVASLDGRHVGAARQSQLDVGQFQARGRHAQQSLFARHGQGRRGRRSQQREQQELGLVGGAFHPPYFLLRNAIYYNTWQNTSY
mmetsp:Transcript_16903/g.46737  ORF Transcript_16903/g.46737 Transcript_16903/m.46737 type:complete len:209 (+) Transcript_16903:539-1165(+)